MALGNNIVVSANPRGNFLEGVISGTPKPGTVCYVKSISNNVITWEPYGTTAASGNDGIGNDGDRALIAVLLPDRLRGKTATEAYVTGDRCFLYCPIPGDDLNMLYQNETGTADDVVFGSRLMVDDGNGMVMLADNDCQAEPFIAMEAYTDPAADQLIWCKFTGC